MNIFVGDTALGKTRDDKTGYEPTSEANHRIANHLGLIASLARLHAQRADASIPIPHVEFRALMQSLAANIEAVARLHRQLSEMPTNERLEAGAVVEDLCRDLKSAFSHADNWTFRWSVQSPCTLTVRQIIPLSVVITELVTNAFKHAHPTGIGGRLLADVMTDSDGSLCLQVRDDGIGLPEGFDAKTSGNKGLAIVRAAAKDLSASFTLESDGLGTSARLRVPHTTLSLVSNTSEFAQERS